MEADYERSESESTGDSECEADDSVTIKVEYYRSFMYQLNWSTMKKTRPKKTLKTKLCKSVAPAQKVPRRPTSDHSQKKPRKQTLPIDEGPRWDLEDGNQEPLRIEEERPADDGVTQTDEDCRSSNCSFGSGPSHPYQDASQDLCVSCWKVYEEAKKMKTTKGSRLDEDPCSLSCDQWVLLKKRRVWRRENTEGKLLRLVSRIKTRLKNGKGKEPCLGSDCSRPHAFLHRNLRGKPKPQHKNQKNKRKREKQACQGPRSAKQQRLHGDGKRTDPSSISSTESAQTLDPGSSGFWDGDSSISPAEEETKVCDLPPSNITVATSQPRKSLGKPKKPQKQNGFKHLLAQLSLNSSTIIKENRKVFM